jgi:4-hydroxy-3-methylbut-2-enyl diphosphate reductase
MQMVLANPRGFCAGVVRAVEIVERVLDALGPPIYVRHEIVHNSHVVADLVARGAVFVDELQDVPDGATVIFSAHGVGSAIYGEAKARGLHVFDATCPLVTKVHAEVRAHSLAGRAVIVVGHRGHAEVTGTLGHYDPSKGDGIFVVETVSDAENVTIPHPHRVAYATQTTLAVGETQKIVDVLRRRFPAIHAPSKSDICYATTDRQAAVRALAERCDVILVLGNRHSSNSVRLQEIAAGTGVDAYLVGSAEDIQRTWLTGRRAIGITSGASAPESLVRGAVALIKTWWPDVHEESFGTPERRTFRLPRGVEHLVTSAEHTARRYDPLHSPTGPR